MDKSLLSDGATFMDEPFRSLLDPRITSALSTLGFARPTLVQAQAIPLVLEGRDVLARARTGSGKTAAYAVPAVQKVLTVKAQQQGLAAGSNDAPAAAVRVVIMVPTKELALQVAKFVEGVSIHCEGLVRCLNAVGGKGGANARLDLDDIPDILITTPSRCLSLLQSRQLSLAHLSLLIIDEADLVLSYGHSADLRSILDPSQNHVPRVGVQGVLTSATMTDDVETLKGWVLRKPAVLTLSEPAASSLLSQYYTRTTETDKFLLLYVLLKLKLVRGKALVFVNSVDRGYRVRLFLEQFGIRACVLNAELPLNSRHHIVEEFNKGAYDYIIATDEAGGAEDEDDFAQEEIKDEGEASGSANLIATAETTTGETLGESSAAGPSSRKSSSATKRKAAPESNKSGGNGKRTKREDRSYGVSRGVDFVNVACVVNFDLPTTPSAYVHRVGRTARAGQTGLALSFVVERKSWGKDKNVMLETAKNDERIFEKIKERVKDDMASEVQEWGFGGRKNEIEGFRYRMEDALKAVTQKRVAEARREELRRELLNSEKLKAHFAANPLDFAYLRHDAPLHPARVQSEMKHVPTYLMPKIASAPLVEEGVEGHVPFASRGRGRGRGRGGRGGRGGGGVAGRGGGKKSNPLKTF